MANIFDVYLREPNPPAGERVPARPQHIFENPAPGPGKDPVGRVESLERAVVYGADLRTTRIPESTAMDPRPVAVFGDPHGRQFGMDDTLLSKHLLMLGGTGMGKSNTFYFLVEQEMRNLAPGSAMLIFDTKGDFRRRFYRSDNPNHVLIGNEEIYREITLAWNLFGELFPKDGRASFRTLEVQLKEMVDHFYRGRKSENQPFFHQAASDLTVKFILDYIKNRRGQFSNEALISELKKTDAAGMVAMLERNPEFHSAKSYLGNPEKLTPQALGVLSYINSMVSDLFIGIFGETRPRGSFSMGRLMEEAQGRVIFLEYDLSVGEVLGPMYSLMIDLALKKVLSREEDGRPHLYLVVDEFKLLPDLQHIENALNYGRSKGIRVCAGIQSVSQVYEVYGEDKGKAILSGFMSCFAFKTLDRESRDYISERFGRNYSNINYNAAGGRHTVQREGYAVEDWDILDLGVGDAYVDLLGHDPFRFHFREYSR